MIKKSRMLFFLTIISFIASNYVYASQEPFTNEDVIELQKIGLGDKVIISKINEVKKVHFQVEIEDLKKLKAAGISQDVISAMIDRKSRDDKAIQSKSTDKPSKIKTTVEYKFGPEVVILKTENKEIKLNYINGIENQIYAFVGFKYEQHFQNLKSACRIKSKTPNIKIKYNKSPLGSCYLIRPGIIKKRKLRYIRSGTSMAGKSVDRKVIIDYDLQNVEGEEDTYIITPKKKLKPGEYGLLVVIPKQVHYGTDYSYMLYDFGIDK